MIDFGDFIKSQRGNVGFPNRKKKIKDVNLNSSDIFEAKAKVQRIIDDGAGRRKRRNGS